MHDGELAGVVRIYSSCAFSEPDRLLIEVMAEELGPLFAAAAAGGECAPATGGIEGPRPMAVGE